MSIFTRDFSGPASPGEPTKDYSPQAARKPDCVPEIVNDRFKIVRKIGEGGMAIVYLAEDLSEGRQVALKLMKSHLTGTAKRRFTREFSTIASLRHPSLIEVYEYGESPYGPFFAMEYYQGETAGALKGKALPIILRALYDLCEAVDFIHQRRIIHRDIKLANILIRRTEDREHFDVRLSDFGLAKFANTSSSLSGDANFLGTIAYCAPEQIMREELDHRADLYALGVVAYELIVGQHPFESRRKDIQALITAQITTMPRGIAEIRNDVSRDLDHAIMRLLSKEAEKRPSSAKQLKDAISQSLGWSAPGGDADSHVDSQNLTGRFVGRQFELAQAEQLISQSLQPAADTDGKSERILFVLGEAGIGKTSIVRRAARKALVVGGRVYDGRCFEGNLAPFQPFAEILRQMLSELEEVKRRTNVKGSQDELATTTFLQPCDASTQIEHLVEQYAIDLLKAGPELRTLLSKQVSLSPYEIQRDSQYLFRSLASFFMEVAQQQPICLIIEDVHWADRSTVELIRQIANAIVSETESRLRGAAFPRLAILCTSRNGSEVRSKTEWVQSLAELNSVTKLELTSIQDSEIPEYVAAVLQAPIANISEEIIEFVSHNCFGIPFYISQTVRDWRDYKAIERSAGTWKFTVKPDSQAQVFTTMRQAVVERLQKLGESARKLIGSASVMGMNLDLELLQEVCGDLSEFEFLDGIDELLARKVFREVEESKHLQFSHDLYRESAAASLSKPRKERTHKTLAELLESRMSAGHPVSPCRLAEHLWSAGESKRALPYFLRATKQAIESQAFGDAASVLNRATECLNHETTKDEIFDYELSKGRILFENGDKRKAIEACKRARENAQSRLQAAQAAFALARMNPKFDENPDSEGLLRESIQALGLPYPKSRFGKLFGAFYYNSLILLTPSRFVRPLRYTLDEYVIMQRALSEFSLHFICTDVVGYSYVSSLGCWMGFRMREQGAGLIGATKFIAVAALCGNTFARIAAAKVQHPNHLHQTLDDPFSQAFMDANRGVYFYGLGALSKAATYFHHAIKCYERTRDWYTLYAIHILRHTRSLQGDVQEAYRVSKREFELAQLIGAPAVLTWAKYGEAESIARMGHVEYAEQIVNEAIDALGSNLSRSIAKTEQTRILLQASKYDAAAESAATGIRWMLRDLFVFEWPLHCFGLLVEALLETNWIPGKQATTRQKIRKATRVSYVARFYATQFPTIRAQVYRACGRLAAAKGKTKASESWLKLSRIAAVQFENRFEYARATIDLALISNSGKAAELCREGLGLLEELHTVLPEVEREIVWERFGFHCPNIRDLQSIDD